MLGEEPVVAGDAEEAEADHEEAGHRPGPEGDVERRPEAVLRGLGRAYVRAHRDVHADEAGGGGEDCTDCEADRRPPAELAVEPDHEERHDGDARDRHVLAAQVGRGALLDGAGDLLHPLVAGRLPQQPHREVEPETHGDARAQEREEHRVVVEEVHQASVCAKPVTK